MGKNDLPTPSGADAVKQAIDAAQAPEPLFPPSDKRPDFVVLDKWQKLGDTNYRPGVYHCTTKTGKDGADPVLIETWLCAPLHVLAVTHDQDENHFGRQLRFLTTNEKWRMWAMAMELLAGDGIELRATLLAMGLQLDPNQAKKQLPIYLQNRTPKKRVLCALQTGWHGDNFVLPDSVIGPSADGVIFQSTTHDHQEHTQAGTLEGWQAGIAAKAPGNPMMLLALSASFTGPLLARCNAEGGGIHIVGDSSAGKTTLLEAACSTWGGMGYKRSWRATSNGMEGAASMFNDCLLALDEISECDPREVGAIVYALGNGKGKQRAGRSGAARGVTRWRCFVVSTGERSIETTMHEGGQRTKAGQSMRLLDVQVTGHYGIWDDLHGADTPAGLSDAIKREAAQHYGRAGRAFLEQLTKDKTDFCAILERLRNTKGFTTEGTDGQEKRAAGRFALIALSGELATEYGLTGWPKGAATKAAISAFKTWQAGRKKGNGERHQIAEQVSGFIQRHGDSRFSDADATGDRLPPVHNRAGWWRATSTGRMYLFNTEGMREALKGFDLKRALDELEAIGALPKKGTKGERANAVRIGGAVFRLYSIDPAKLVL